MEQLIWDCMSKNKNSLLLYSSNDRDEAFKVFYTMKIPRRYRNHEPGWNLFYRYKNGRCRIYLMTDQLADKQKSPVIDFDNYFTVTKYIH